MRMCNSPPQSRAQACGTIRKVSFWVVVSSLLLPFLLAADWPQFLGPTRNAVSSEVGLNTSWGEGGPTALWTKEVGSGYSSPVIADGRLLIFHRVGDEEVLQCLDAHSGKPLWKTASPTRYVDDFGKGDGPRSTPLVTGRSVVTLGADGRLQCLELQTGRKIWERALHEDFVVSKGFFGVATSPIAEDGLVLVNVGSKQAGIVAFALDTGKEVWRATDQGASYSSPVAATIDGVRHVFFFTREGLASLDPRNGAVRLSKPWRSRFQASVNAATPVIIQNRLFLSASYNTGAVMLRVRRDGLEELWKGDDVLSNHYTTSICHQNFLYGFDGRQEQRPRLRCVAAASGLVQWTKEGFGCGSMLLAEGKLIVLTEDGDLVSIEATPEAYREICRARVLSAPCRAALALSDGRLYGRDDHKLVCWNLKK